MRNKILLLFLVFGLLPNMIAAQPLTKVDNKHYLFGMPLQYNGYGGPVVAFSNMEGRSSVAPGAVAGLLINAKFFMSIYGQKVETSHPRPDMIVSGPIIYTEVKANMWQYGVWFGYIHKPEDVIHWGMSSMVARGQLFLTAKDPVTLATRQIYDDRVYFITPKFFVEMNMAKWLKMNVSAGYRFTGKVNGEYSNQYDERIPTFNPSDYNQPEFSVSLLFGGFTSKSNSSE